MKQKTIVSIFGLAFLLFTPFISAEEVRTTTESVREEVRTTVRERQENRQERREDRQESRQERTEDREARRQEFREQLVTIRDERKREVVEKINDRLERVNTKATTHWVEVLQKLEAIVTRIDSRAQELQGQGVDVSQIEASLTLANNAIAKGQSAVSSQAGKDYTIQIEDEATLRNTVGTAMSGLHTDLRLVHQTVIAAKQAVMKAAMELAKIKNYGN